MPNLAFPIYLLFIVSWFLHLTARIPALGIVRFDLLIVVVLFGMKFLKGSEVGNQIQDDCSRKLNQFIFTVLLITPFAEWPGSVLSRGLTVFLKAVVFFYFTIWFVKSQKQYFLFLGTVVGCQIVRFMEPLYLHVTQGYWGDKAYMAGTGGTEFMNRLAGAPSDIINPNGLALVVISVLPFLVCIYKVNIYFKIIAIMLVPSALYALMLTGSRSGMLALLIMGLILFYRSNKKLYFIIGTAIVAFLIIGSISEIQIDRYRSIFDADTKNAGTSEGRLRGLSRDFSVVLRRPLLGHGLGCSLEANANFRENAQPSHNIFIEVLQELGLVGFFMFFRYVWSVIKSLHLKIEAGADDLRTTLLMSIKDAIAVLAVTTLFFGFASYGLSCNDWYLIGGCVVLINKLLLHQSNNQVLQNI